MNATLRALRVSVGRSRPFCRQKTCRAYRSCRGSRTAQTNSRRWSSPTPPVRQSFCGSARSFRRYFRERPLYGGFGLIERLPHSKRTPIRKLSEFGGFGLIERLPHSKRTPIRKLSEFREHYGGPFCICFTVYAWMNVTGLRGTLRGGLMVGWLGDTSRQGYGIIHMFT